MHHLSKEYSTVERRSIVELVVAVDIAALCILASIFLAGLGEQPALLVLLGGLAAAVSIRPIRICAIKLHLAPTDAFILTAMAMLGPLAAMLIGLVANVAAAVGGGRRMALPRLAFNAGTTVLSVGCAWWLFLTLDGAARGGLAGLILPLAAAAAVFFAVNAVLVSAPISIERRSGYAETLREVARWSAPTVLVGLGLAWSMIALLESYSIWTLIFVVIPCWALAFVYRVRVQRRGFDHRAPAR
jgi:hypothetical protein